MQSNVLETNRTLRNNIKAKRGDATLEDVANAIGLTRSALSLLERGETMPKRETLEALCSYFKCDVGDLYFAEELFVTPPENIFPKS